MTTFQSTANAGQEDTRRAERIDPARAAAGVARWRRALAEALGEDPGARLDRPDRKLAMLRIFGSTRRLADLCLKHPAAAAEALVEGASSVLAQAARDLSGLGLAVGGADALYGALSPLKARADLAIGIAEVSGEWTAGEATAARTDFAERLVETASAWLIRGAVNRGELAVDLAEGPVAGVFALAGGDFAHEDLAPYGPLDVVVLYDEAMFSGPAARMAERAFVRIGAEMREAFEGKPGDYPIFTLRTPFGTGVSGAGLTESRGRAAGLIADKQQCELRAWVATARVVAGDRRSGGAFLEDTEETVWTNGAASHASASYRSEDPRAPFRAVADAFRLRLGGARPVFRTASARAVFETAAKSGVLRREIASRLIAGDEFAQSLVARAQMMKGAAAYGAARADEEEALASLCGFSDYAGMKAALDGMRADAANAQALVEGGPQAEFDRYKPAGDCPDDIDKLRDLGFQDGAGLAGIVDQWANITAAGGVSGRFSAVAPGLLTAFGETQHPDQAVRLFDALLRHASHDDLSHRLGAESPVRDGLVDALGCFGAAVEPLTDSPALAARFFEERGAETPRNGGEWLARHAPPKDGASLEDIAQWRRETIGAVALCAASGDMSFDAAADTLETANNAVLAAAMKSVAKNVRGGEHLALHVFDGPARGLPGAPTLFGFIATEGEAGAGEEFARAYLAALDGMGEGYFAFTPDVTHRPGAAAGELAPTAPAFKAYIQSEAVAYDQILLARARVIAGSEKAQAKAKAALRAAVANPKRADILFRDLDRARAQRLRRDKAASEWDLDCLEGGLQDVELIISTLIYRNAASQPGVQDGDVDAALDILARAGALPVSVAETLKSARAFWTRLATAKALARWSDPQREPVRSRFAAVLARAAEVERFNQVRPIMRGYADEVGRLYAQLVLGRPALSLVANA